MYEYTARLIDVHDGDTIRVEVDLGIEVRVKLTLRLLGLNAPELATPEGPIARNWLVAALGDGRLRIRTVKDRREKYGRYLADIFLIGDGAFDKTINDKMIEAGHALPYDGHGPKPV